MEFIKNDAFQMECMQIEWINNGDVCLAGSWIIYTIQWRLVEVGGGWLN